jgi:xanthine dehydrogenase accessory factor
MHTASDTFNVLAHAAELRAAGRPFALATVTLSQRPTSARLGAKAVITPDGALFGWVGGACSQPSVIRHAREVIASGEPRLLRLSPDSDGVARAGIVELPMTCHSGGTIEVFIEPFLPEPYLIALGDSPVAQALLALGKSLGFRTVAAGVAASEADETLPTLELQPLGVDRAAFVVVATMGVDDEASLLAALGHTPAYLALVGSRRRFDTLVDFLRTQGIEETQIATIHAPAGLDIGAQTPAEIALSILAEAVQVRSALRRSGQLQPVPQQARADPARVVIDPVCGMEVDLATARHVLVDGGEMLGFCCAGCLREYRQRQTA